MKSERALEADPWHLRYVLRSRTERDRKTCAGQIGRCCGRDLFALGFAVRFLTGAQWRIEEAYVRPEAAVSRKFSTDASLLCGG